MKEKSFFCLKAVAAGAVAFVVLNILCIFYFNVPIHEPSKTKSTDYIWQPDKFYSRGTEGFAKGVTDKKGFNNLKTFEEDEIDVLVMGSSHMEAFNVAQNKNAVALLNDTSKELGLNFNFYNIGISGHTLEKCLYNLENAVCEFAPKEYVVIETQSVKPGVGSLKAALEGKLNPIESHNEGIIGKLQKFPYLRLVYTQMKNAKESELAEETKQIKRESNDTEERCVLLDELIQRSAKICDENGVKLIIFYNCTVEIDENGNVLERKELEDVRAFSEICENNNVIFIDMYEDFKDDYIKTHKLSRGFSNSEAGKGHINEDGHRIISKRLFDVISKSN